MGSASTEGVTYLIIEVARVLRRRYHKALREAGIGITQAESWALKAIKENPGLNQTALARLMRVEPMTVLGYLARLEQLGLIERVADPADGRSKIIKLMPRGRAAMARTSKVGRANRAEIADVLGSDESERLRLTLLRIRDSLIEDDQEGPEIDF